MTAKVFALDTVPGIQRDGTLFDKMYYTDGLWVRFQRGRPRKIGGYRQIVGNLFGPSRGIYVNPQQAFTNVFSGYSNGLQKLPINSLGIGSGLVDFTLNNFTLNDNNLWQFDIFTDGSGSGNTYLLSHPGQNLALLDNNTNTPVLGNLVNDTVASQIGIFTDTGYTVNGSPTVSVSSTNILIGAGQTVTSSAGIPANTTVVSANIAFETLNTVTVTGTSGTFSCAATPGLFIDQTITLSGAPENAAIVSPVVTGTSGTFSCTSSMGLFVNQPVTVTGDATVGTIVNPVVTGTSGTFTCTASVGLYVGQPVTITGGPAAATLVNPAITGTSGTFSCNSTIGLFVGQQITVSGTLASTALANVQVTSTSGDLSFTTVSGIFVGQAVVVTGTLTGTATGITTGTTYYVIGTPTSTTAKLSATPGGAAITTTAGTTTGLVFSVQLQTGITSGTTYFITTTNGSTTFTLSTTAGGTPIVTVVNALTGLSFNTTQSIGLNIGQTYFIIATNGTTSFTLSTVAGGSAITTIVNSTSGYVFSAPKSIGLNSGQTYYIIATNGSTTFTLSATIGGSAVTTVVNDTTGYVLTVPKSIGLTPGTTYYVIATNGSTTFTLSATSGGAAVTTVVNSTTGFTFITGNYYKVVLNNNATATGSRTLTFDNNVSVSGGVVVLHPYVFVYGNNGFIKNSSAGNFNDWVSADANEVNVATGKIVQGLPVRGGSNAPSGLFWSLDSLIRVSYIGGSGTPPQFWRYDIVTSQSSIMSSQSVIEYDGIYYWCGVDRFLLYNGVVKEIPNSMNQNYFFDNLNYDQRQKVWVTKVPKFGEVWWFYPRGNATECTDAIIYNIRENTWYDAGQAPGARRSAGYFSQIFHYPIAAGTDINTYDAIDKITVLNAGSGYTNGTYYNLAVTGIPGTGATITITVAGGVVTNATLNSRGSEYVVDNFYSAVIPGGSGFEFRVDNVMNMVPLWQHELGVDAVQGPTVLAIESSFETNDLGWVSGGPAQPSPIGENNWLRLERVEPDFIMSGPMSLVVTGRPYAQADDSPSDPYIFDADTHKIDMREQRRELRLKFTSNVQNGNYQLGKLIVNADFGDVRGY